tara:strand:+ start:179 stop:340 length:162 start_codon:yes stop_codon:yes gene_type:complete
MVTLKVMEHTLLLTSEHHQIALFTITLVTGSKSPKSPNIIPPNIRAFKDKYYE